MTETVHDSRRRPIHFPRRPADGIVERISHPNATRPPRRAPEPPPEKSAVPIRQFQPGDEAAQASIFNEAAAGLPGFKPAQPQEIRKRALARDFDPATRFFAEEGGRLVGYCGFQACGRISYPWCKKGFEQHAEPLFTAALDALTGRGVRRAFAAYRSDWP